MANWKLGTPHYLNLVDQAIWEYKEVDRKTGRQKITKFPVPTLLNPDDSSDWSERTGDEGIVIVSDGEAPMRGAHIFIGDPTPDMLPLDDAARAITKKFEPVWGQGPIEGLPNSYADSILDNLQKEVMELRAAAAVSGGTTKIEGMDTLVQSLAAMMSQNQAILEKLVSAQAPARRS